MLSNLALFFFSDIVHTYQTQNGMPFSLHSIILFVIFILTLFLSNWSLDQLHVFSILGPASLERKVNFIPSAWLLYNASIQSKSNTIDLRNELHTWFVFYHHSYLSSNLSCASFYLTFSRYFPNPNFLLFSHSCFPPSLPTSPSCRTNPTSKFLFPFQSSPFRLE